MAYNLNSGTGQVSITLHSGGSSVNLTAVEVNIVDGPASLDPTLEFVPTGGVFPVAVAATDAPVVVGVIKSSGVSGINFTNVAEGTFFGNIIASLNFATDNVFLPNIVFDAVIATVAGP